MATRMVTDCDRCGKENISESFRLQVSVIEVHGSADRPHKTENRRIDLDTKCLGAELQKFLNKLTPEQGDAWLAQVAKSKGSGATTEATT